MDFNTLFIGNIAFDINSFYYGNNEEKLRVINNGGACFYSAVPASLFYKVGIVPAKVQLTKYIVKQYKCSYCSEEVEQPSINCFSNESFLN